MAGASTSRRFQDSQDRQRYGSANSGRASLLTWLRWAAAALLVFSGALPLAAQTTGQTVEDPTGDIEKMFEEFDGVENPDSGGDITGMRVEIEEGFTRVVVTFAGSAADITERTGQILQGDLLFIPADGGPIIEVLVEGDGSSKVSDGPPGVSVSSEWTQPNELTLVVQGVTPDEGDTVRYLTAHRGERTGSSSDGVDLVVSSQAPDGGGSAPAEEEDAEAAGTAEEENGLPVGPAAILAIVAALT